MSKRLPKTFNCPTEFTLAVLGGKWKTVILCYLKQQPWRYSDLRKLVPELSDKMLTERLRDLMGIGLVLHHKQGAGRMRKGVRSAICCSKSMHRAISTPSCLKSRWDTR